MALTRENLDLLAIDLVKREVGKDYLVGNPVFPKNNLMECFVDVIELNGRHYKTFLVYFKNNKIFCREILLGEEYSKLGQEAANLLKKSHDVLSWQKAAK